ILEWIFSRVDDLKTKAYLAQFLVRIEVPTEFLTDPEVSELYSKYEQQLEEFKRLHKLKQQNESLGNAEEIRKDIEKMEEEKLQLQNRLQIYKK
uniref:hypothetical protein n=1 Tax=Salmonella sp. s51228 TaxID=3159652 RepID=UPI00397EF853